LNASGLSNLQDLRCNGNQLTTLNVSGLSNLQILQCKDNQLTILDVSGHSDLHYLDCSSNNIGTLYLIKDHRYDSLTYDPGVNIVYGSPSTQFYTLTVANGSGSGSYEAGQAVNISANPAPSGQVFEKWVSSGGGAFANAAATSTTFTMPAAAVTVTATYKQAQEELPPSATDISPAQIAPIADVQWTGKPIRPALSVKIGSAVLKEGADYSVSYSGNTTIGKCTVTLIGIGNYKGTKTASFNITPQKLKISKATAGKKQVKVTWAKAATAQKITGYEVRYTLKGTGKWKTKAAAAKSTSLTIKKLKKGKTYQIQVRAYKTVSKVKYYSAWSPAKTSKKVK
jgi:hypothetical protein